MALIKCPECGQEISDKARICPNCRIELKKQKNININKKYAIMVGIFIVCILIVFSVRNSQSNVFSEYTKYIGGTYENLPDGYEQGHFYDDLWYMEREIQKGENKFALTDGKINYSYSENGFDAYDAKADEIYSMSFSIRNSKITQSLENQYLKLLKKSYGNYDEVKKLDNSVQMYSYKDSEFLCNRYIWKNEHDIEILFDVETEDEKIDKILISWRKVLKEE